MEYRQHSKLKNRIYKRLIRLDVTLIFGVKKDYCYDIEQTVLLKYSNKQRR